MKNESAPRRAIVRLVSPRFAEAVSRHGSARAIDVGLASEQHARYVEGLRACGIEVEILSADADLPDCCFVEDCAVVASGRALITRPGHPARAAEPAAVAAALARHVETTSMKPPATLDGGDCLQIGDVIYAGLSTRTGREGIAQLEAIFAPLGHRVVTLDVGDTLHLKTVCTYLGRGHLLLAEDTLPAHLFEDMQIVWVPSDEAYAANALAAGGAVLVSDGYPRTRERIEQAGFTTIAVPTTEFRKADGSLTCLSILFG